MRQWVLVVGRKAFINDPNTGGFMKFAWVVAAMLCMAAVVMIAGCGDPDAPKK